MLTFAKGVGNGYALGGVVARAEVMDCLNATSFNTFGGNPISSAAGNAVLDYILSHDLQVQAARVGAILHQGLRAAAGTLPMVADVRGRGLMIAVEFAEPGTLTPAPAVALRVLEECKAGGLLVGKGGLYGHVIRMGPPLTLTEAEARQGLSILVDAMRRATR
jgi:4-aminobutyrate aminotransferase